MASEKTTGTGIEIPSSDHEVLDAIIVAAHAGQLGILRAKDKDGTERTLLVLEPEEGGIVPVAMMLFPTEGIERFTPPTLDSYDSKGEVWGKREGRVTIAARQLRSSPRRR